MTTTPFRMLMGLALTVVLMLNAKAQPQPPIVASIAPPPRSPTLAEKVRSAERIVVAKVGQLQYMRWTSPSDSLGPWDVSDTPLAGYVLYMNLLNSKVVYEEPSSNHTQHYNERLDLPLWVEAGCFGFGLVGDRYQHFPPPVGESRVFFLSSKLLRSDNKIHTSMCQYPALLVTEVPDIQYLLRDSPFKSKLMDICLRAGKTVVSASDTQVVCRDAP